MAKPDQQQHRNRRAVMAGRLVAAVAAAGLAVASLSGCEGVTSAKADANAKPVVLTSFTVIADMARQVAGDRVDIHSITKVGADVHGYEPTPNDLKAAAKADVVFQNGMNLERWFDQFIERSGAKRVTLSEGIKPISITGDSQYAGKPNPHAWMSPANAVIYVENIRKALTELDPAGAETYARNAAAYTRKLNAVGSELQASLAAVPPSQRALVTCEGAFSYLARDLGMTEQYLWPVNAERQGTPKQIAATITFVKERKVPGVFCESTVSGKPMQQVAGDSDSRFAGTLYVDSLSKPDGPVPTYLDLLRVDAETIARGLTPTPQKAAK